MNQGRVYVLGGHQTDFAHNCAREHRSISDLFETTVRAGLDAVQLDPNEIEVGHVANFESSLYTAQSHLGGFFGHVDPSLRYLPASRHEAACASGSMAILAAMADIESTRYGLACVLGVEIMRQRFNDSVDRLQGAAWVGNEWQDAKHIWPRAFSDMIELYQERFGLESSHLQAISRKNFDNAKRNPLAQTRDWTIDSQAYGADDERNPVIEGHIRRLDCGQITDGAAVIFLASETRAKDYASKRGIKLEDIPHIKGWGHVNAPMSWREKRRISRGSDTPFPQVRSLFKQTLARANMPGLQRISGVELHDCFNITEYMILDHAGLNRPGLIWQNIEQGDFEMQGKLPVNPSGGLIGAGHPVGATGIRMLFDCAKQVTHTAGDNQIPNARNMMTVNIGGSTTTCASFVVGK